jgi:hypothetical protein
MHDLIAACCILHNILLGQSQEGVARLLRILHEEGLDNDREDDLEADDDGGYVVDPADAGRGTAEDLQNGLSVFVVAAREVPQL